MRISTKLLLVLAFAFCLPAVFAQKKPVKGAQNATPKKINPPKLNTYLDTYRDSVGISAQDAERVIAMPLKIYDDNKNEYSISSYNFLYKKKVVTEDEQGKVSGANSISSDLFKVSPLPTLWVNLIRQDVKAGEEFFFFDVIAKDAQGRVMYAPNLKISIR